MIQDEYRSIDRRYEATLKVRGSSFIATASPVPSETEAAHLVQEVSRRYFDATHNCYAYRIGFGPSPIHRSSDDGEPSGTAGKPILQVITGRQLTDVVVVVTRYFGGTKLGTGGLARAYSNATSLVLDQCDIVIHIVYQPLRVRFPYEETSTVMRLVDGVNGRITRTKYDRDTEMTIQIRGREWANFKERLVNATRGQVFILED